MENNGPERLPVISRLYNLMNPCKFQQVKEEISAINYALLTSFPQINKQYHALFDDSLSLYKALELAAPFQAAPCKYGKAVITIIDFFKKAKHTNTTIVGQARTQNPPRQTNLPTLGGMMWQVQLFFQFWALKSQILEPFCSHRPNPHPIREISTGEEFG